MGRALALAIVLTLVAGCGGDDQKRASTPAAFVQEDAPVNLQATLAAPPDEVTTVDVVVPNVKTFTGVSLAG